jgi:hypothetical protein
MSESTLDDYLDIQSFIKQHPQFRASQIRWMIVKKDENGIQPCLKRLGRRIYINVPKFLAWVNDTRWTDVPWKGRKKGARDSVEMESIEGSNDAHIGMKQLSAITGRTTVRINQVAHKQEKMRMAGEKLSWHGAILPYPTTIHIHGQKHRYWDRLEIIEWMSQRTEQ